MKTAIVISEGTNHKAVDLGTFTDLLEYSYPHPKRQQEIKGKQFIGEMLKTTGAEVSFSLLPPFTEIPFLHKHNQHEEIYVFLKGKGQFQIDDSVFDVTEGTVIRVAPEGKRTYRNNSADPLIFICIQCMAGSFKNYFVEDGSKAEGTIAWVK